MRQEMFMRFLGRMLGGLLLGGLVGCGATQPAGVDGLPERTGLALSLTLDAKTDVRGMRFVIDRMSCAGEAVTPFHQSFDKNLEDIRLPGGLPGFEDAPLDGDSSHTFADLFLELDVGCYQLTTQPLAAGGALSVDCERASTSGVRIVEGRTTEILLINQCEGEGSGGIDVVSALDHPPELLKVEFKESSSSSSARTRSSAPRRRIRTETPSSSSGRRPVAPRCTPGPRW